MLITDGKKVVEIEIRNVSQDPYHLWQDITQDLILDDGYKYDRVIDMWIIQDVDFCVEQVKDMVYGKGEWKDDGPITDVELTINQINSKTDDFSVDELITICHLARDKAIAAKSLEDMNMYTGIEDIAMSMLLGN